MEQELQPGSMDVEESSLRHFYPCSFLKLTVVNLEIFGIGSNFPNMQSGESVAHGSVDFAIHVFLQNWSIMDAAILIHSHEVSVEERIVECVQAEDVVKAGLLLICSALAPWDDVAASQNLPFLDAGDAASASSFDE